MKKKFYLFFLLCLVFSACSPSETSNEKEIVEDESEDIVQDSIKLMVDKYVLSNEDLIFSFETTKGKKLTIVVDKNEKYIKYRFGTKDKIELEYPSTNENTWDKFEGFFYLRGGGPENEGLEEFRLTFENHDVIYEVHEDYYSVTDERTIGVKVSVGDKEIEIKGVDSTQIGSLYNLRDYEELEQME